MANSEETKARHAFDAAVIVKLGAPMSKHDLPSDGVDADTPTFELYEDDVTPHSGYQRPTRSPLRWLTPMLEPSNRNMSKSKGWTLQSSLLKLWMEKTRVNNQTKIDDDVHLLKTL